MFNFYYFLFFVIICLNGCMCIFQEEGEKLLIMQEVLRHGARTPIRNLFNSSFDKNNPGILTEVGEIQQYKLGNIIRQQYFHLNGFIDHNQSYSKQIYVRSTNYQRTIQSVEYQLKGLFQEKLNIPKYYFVNSPSHIYQPPWNWLDTYHTESDSFKDIQTKIPINVKSILEDYELQGYMPEVCPNLKKMDNQPLKNQLMAQIYNEEQNTFTNFKNMLNIDNLNLDLIAGYVDNYYCDIYADPSRSLSSAITPELWRNLTYLYNISNYIEYFTNYDQSRLIESAFFQMVLKSTDNAIANSKRNNTLYKKMNFYSSHDTNILSLFSFLNLTSWQCIRNKWRNITTNDNTVCLSDYPIFATSAIFELVYNSKNNAYYIRLRIDGEYIPLCSKYPNHSKDYGITCEYNFFKELIQENIFTDYKERCNQQQ